MKTSAWMFAFAMVFGLAAYAVMAAVAPEIGPGSYRNVVGLVGLIGAAVGKLVGDRWLHAHPDAGRRAPPPQHLNIACGDQFTVRARAGLVVFLRERHGLGGELSEPDQICVLQPLEVDASVHGALLPNKTRSGATRV